MNATATRTVTKIEANPLLVKSRTEKQIKRVAAYCRVSTDDEEQLNSYTAQIEYYTEKIAHNPSWQFVGIYADEGISGTATKKRKEFLRLMHDCEKGKVDLILTKSISRFARNTVDSLSWVRKLRAMNVGVYFEEQGIDSLKAENEMLIGLFSVIAQSESENIGANVRWGIRHRMKNGDFHANFQCYGYKCGEDEIPIVIEEEAEVVRSMFQRVLDGDSIDQIKAHLESNNIETSRGKNIWSKTMIRHMLTNEKYVGDLLLQKTFVTDSISKKQKKNNGELAKYLVSNNHPAIIDRDTFNMVQVELTRRSNLQKKSNKCLTEKGGYSGIHALSNLLFCGCCGSHYKRREKNVKGVKKYYWRCIGRIDGHCKEAIAIEETKLQAAICRCMSDMIQFHDEVEQLCLTNLRYAITGDEHILDASAIENQIKNYQEQIDLLMEKEETTGGDPERYEKEIIKLYEKVSLLRGQMKLAKEQADQNTEANAELERFVKLFKEYGNTSITEYDDVTVRRLVECIQVMPDKRIVVTLKGGMQGEEKLD